jgi:hypothetical protein
MAAVDDSLSRYVQALLTQIEWGSPLLASASGTAAWVHGSDAAWWLGASMQKYPEQFPLEVAAQARRYYEIAVPQVLKTATKQERPPEDTPEARCRAVCLGQWDYDGCVQECTRRGGPPRTICEAFFPRPVCTQHGLVAIVIGVGLVLLGAWALVK